MEFQAYHILVISSDIRQLENIEKPFAKGYDFFRFKITISPDDDLYWYTKSRSFMDQLSFAGLELSQDRKPNHIGIKLDKVDVPGTKYWSLYNNTDITRATQN